MWNDVKYDSILIIICHVTKYALFILTREASTAVEFAELFFEHIEYHFETPRNIMIDRDFYIILKFWHEIYEI